jgi:hypothetical protein
VRRLPGGSSLPQLLHRRRGGIPNIQDLPDLTEQQIVAWADIYRRRTGYRPTARSGSIPCGR